MVITGGSDGRAVYADLYIFLFGMVISEAPYSPFVPGCFINEWLHYINWIPESRTWVAIDVRSCPSPRYFNSGVVYKDKLYIFGGKNRLSQCFDDIHCLDMTGNLKKINWKILHLISVN
jgi:hypothetical protein